MVFLCFCSVLSLCQFLAQMKKLFPLPLPTCSGQSVSVLYPPFLNPALAHLIRAEGYSKQASFGVAFGGVLNILLDPLFIYGLRLQITGAAIATIIYHTLALLYSCSLSGKIEPQALLTLSPRMYRITDHIPSEVLSIGLPIFLSP